MGNTVIHNKDELMKCIKKKDAFKVDKKMSEIIVDGEHLTLRCFWASMGDKKTVLTYV